MNELEKQVWKNMEEMGWENAPQNFHLEYFENIIECTKQALSIADISTRLSKSLGECVEGNDYEIVSDRDGSR